MALKIFTARHSLNFLLMLILGWIFCSDLANSYRHKFKICRKNVIYIERDVIEQALNRVIFVVHKRRMCLDEERKIKKEKKR